MTPRAGSLAVATLFTLLLLAVGSWLAAPPAASATSRWRWPVAALGEPRIVRPFDPPSGPYSPGHRGVDLAAAAGDSALAAAEGVVSFAGWVAGRPVVVITHGDLRTTYEPVLPAVSAGRRVAAGDPLGAIQPAGGHCAPAVCLHWGLRRGDSYLDPLAVVGGGPPRLLPVWESPPDTTTAAPAPARPASSGSGTSATRIEATAGTAWQPGRMSMLAGALTALGGSAALAVAARRGPRRAG